LAHHKRLNLFISFAIYILLTLFLFSIYIQAELRTEQERFKSQTNTLINSIQEKTRVNELVLTSVRAYLSQNPQTSTQSLNNFAQQIFESSPQLYMLEIQQRVNHAQVSDFEKRYSNLLNQKYKVKSFSYNGTRQWEDLKAKDIHYPITYLYPSDPSTMDIYGLDVYSIPHLKPAIEQSIQTNEIAASAIFELVEGGKAYIVFLPIWSSVDKNQSKIQLPEKLISVLVKVDFLLPSNNPIIQTSKIKLKPINEASNHFQFYVNNQHNDGFTLRHLKLSEPVGNKGQRFMIDVDKRINFSFLNVVTFIAIACINGLVFLFLYKQYMVHKQANNLEIRFGQILDNSSNEIYIFNSSDLKFEVVNKGAQQNLGYTMDELLQLTPYDIKPEYEREQFINLLGPLYSGEQELLQFETNHQRKDGTTYPVEINLQLARSEDPQVFVAIILDISDRKQAQERLLRLANYDDITGLPNRNLFKDRLQHAIEIAHHQNKLVGLMFIDVDNFKKVNDTLGHSCGDTLLQQIALRVKGVLRESDTVCRIGGDEYTVIIEDFAHQEQLANIANKILLVLDQSFDIEQHKLFNNVSIGITTYPIDGTSIEILIKNADTAMYEAKEKGKARYQFYTQDMNEKAFRRMELENDLRIAVNENQFELWYQPQLDTKSQEIRHVEALIRWRHPIKGLISPLDFIPIAEESGIILDIGTWVINAAAQQIIEWRDSYHATIGVSINVSGRQFKDPQFVQHITDVTNALGNQKDLLEIEITESVLLDDLEQNIEKLHAIRSLGIKIAIDDFGTGYSSLNYLKRFPVDILKIDRSFLVEIPDNQQDRAIVNTIIELCRHLKIDIVAEGIETEQQLQFLVQHHCDFVQGFLLSRPLPIPELEQWIQLHLKRAS